jgi:hypothetical protein
MLSRFLAFLLLFVFANSDRIKSLVVKNWERAHWDKNFEVKCPFQVIKAIKQHKSTVLSHSLPQNAIFF